MFESNYVFGLKPFNYQRPRFNSYRRRAYNNPGYIESKEELAGMAEELYQGEPDSSPMKVSLVFRFIKPKSAKKRKYPSVKPDIDNLCKAVLDSLNGVFWKDDNQIVELKAQKEYGEREEIELLIERMD